MKAMKCDVCGELSEEHGEQFRVLTYKATNWKREHTSDYRVHLRLEPVNTGNDSYSGIDICKKCFASIARTALQYFGGA